MWLAWLMVLAAPPVPWTEPTGDRVEAILSGAAVQLSMADRLELATRPFVGAPYVLSPLGEGDLGGTDPDPRLRFDAFDCTTFVETALRTWGLDNAARLPERILKLRQDISHFILPERRDRSYPRVVKIKMSNYARKRPSAKRRAK